MAAGSISTRTPRDWTKPRPDCRQSRSIESAQGLFRYIVVAEHASSFAETDVLHVYRGACGIRGVEKCPFYTYIVCAQIFCNQSLEPEHTMTKDVRFSDQELMINQHERAISEISELLGAMIDVMKLGQIDQGPLRAKIRSIQTLLKQPPLKKPGRPGIVR
jgi:hypothetical protein